MSHQYVLVTVSGFEGLPDAPVSKYLSYLGLMVEGEAQPAIPPEWPQDLTHVTPIPLGKLKYES